MNDGVTAGGYLGHVQVHTGAQRLATVSGLNDMFPGNGVQRFEMFSLVW